MPRDGPIIYPFLLSLIFENQGILNAFGWMWEREQAPYRES